MISAPALFCLNGACKKSFFSWRSVEGKDTDNATGINNILTAHSRTALAFDNNKEKSVIYYLKSGMQILCEVHLFTPKYSQLQRNHQQAEIFLVYTFPTHQWVQWSQAVYNDTSLHFSQQVTANKSDYKEKP